MNLIARNAILHFIVETRFIASAKIIEERYVKRQESIINNSTNKHFNNSTIITIFANYYLKKRNFVFMSSLVKDFENVECFF